MIACNKGSLEKTAITVYEKIPEIKSLLADIFDAEKEAFRNFEYLSDGISNLSFRFIFRKDSYIIRYPWGEHQEERLELECEAYRLLKKSNIRCTDELIYFDIKKGIKVTKYISAVYYPDLKKEEHVQRCLNLLKSIHESGIQSSRCFEFMEILLYNEKDLTLKAGDYLENYKEMRKNFIQIYNMLPKEQELKFCHIDPIKYNFLLTDTQDYIIDFEYSQMCNPVIDLASFAIYSHFNEQQLLHMLKLYYNHPPTEEERILLYKYLALDGLISALWYLNRIKEDASIKTAMYQSYEYAKCYSSKLLKEKN